MSRTCWLHSISSCGMGVISRTRQLPFDIYCFVSAHVTHSRGAVRYVCGLLDSAYHAHARSRSTFGKSHALRAMSRTLKEPFDMWCNTVTFILQIHWFNFGIAGNLECPASTMCYIGPPWKHFGLRFGWFSDVLFEWPWSVILWYTSFRQWEVNLSRFGIR